MTPQGLTSDLLLAAASVGILGFALTVRQLPPAVSLSLAIIKVAIPLVYFAWFYDGTWTIIDDLKYYEHGQQLGLEFEPVSALIHEEGRARLVELSEGRHFLYAWWNLVAQSLFGEHYYAAVFLNVLLTFFVGVVLFGLLGEIGFGRSYRHGVLVFFLLHWDVLAWSSLINLKDVLVMSLIVPALYCLSILRTRFQALALLGAAASLFALTWLRFYISVLLLAAFVVWVVFEGRFRWKYAYAILAVAAFAVLPVDWSAIDYLQPGQIAFGLPRMLLTPQPWSIQREYSFLLIPSIFHWLLFVPMVLAAFSLWSYAAAARYVITFVVLVMLFYAIVPELQGPRHRLQLAFAIAWMQFHFFWETALLALRSNVSTNRPAIDERAK